MLHPFESKGSEKKKKHLHCFILYTRIIQQYLTLCKVTNNNGPAPLFFNIIKRFHEDFFFDVTGEREIEGTHKRKLNTEYILSAAFISRELLFKI